MFTKLKDYLEKKELSVGEIIAAFDLLKSSVDGIGLCKICGEKEIEDTKVCRVHLRVALVHKWN